MRRFILGFYRWLIDGCLAGTWAGGARLLALIIPACLAVALLRAAAMPGRWPPSAAGLGSNAAGGLLGWAIGVTLGRRRLHKARRDGR